MIEEKCKYINSCEDAKSNGLKCINQKVCNFYDTEDPYDNQILGCGAPMIDIEKLNNGVKYGRK